MSAISFCDCETTTAMSVSRMNAICCVDARALERRQALRARSPAPRGAVAHSRADEVVHPHRGRLVDRDEHRLAEEAAADEVADEVGGDALQTRRAGDELVLGREAPRQRALLLLVELGLLEDRP